MNRDPTTQLSIYSLNDKSPIQKYTHLNLPHARISNVIQRKLAKLSYKDDAEELMEEGFIVADDYFSQDSSAEGNECDKQLEVSRKELLIKQLERHEHRLRGTSMKPYILLDGQVNLGDYRAVCLLKKPKPVRPASRVSFGATSTADESGPDFPLSVEKSKNQPPAKVLIKDVIDHLIELGHGLSTSKKQLIELFKKEHQDLKKSHLEVFVKECFEKSKRPLDSKVSSFNL